jgi:hypothetical protein
MNPNLAQELLAARLNDALVLACRHRLAAAAAPPAALRQRWGARLVSLGAAIARDPDIIDPNPFGREVDRGDRPVRSSVRAVRGPRGCVGS